MKIQDIVFVLAFVFLIFKSYKWSIIAGLACIVISIPLFALRIFFTAEHLIWYSVAFFLIAIVKIAHKEFKS